MTLGEIVGFNVVTILDIRLGISLGLAFEPPLDELIGLIIGI